MEIINDKKLSLIAKLVVAYVLLLNCAFLIFALTAQPNTDVASVTASLLGWTATLFTPIAAYILYDSWKDQHNKNFETERLLELIKLIKKISISINLLSIPIGHFKSLEKIFSDLLFQHENILIEDMIVKGLKEFYGYNTNSLNPNKLIVESKLDENKIKLKYHLDLFIKDFNSVIETKEEIILEFISYLTLAQNKKSNSYLKEATKILSNIDKIQSEINKNIANKEIAPNEISSEFNKYQDCFKEIQMGLILLLKDLYKETKA